MLLGVHAGIAGGLENAPQEAREVYGAECFQMFSKNQRQWAAKPLAAEDIAAFRDALKRFGYDPKTVFIHASYLINVCSPDAAVHKKSLAALSDELERATALGVLGVCFHPGSHKGKGEDWGVRRIRAAMEKVLEGTSEGALLLIEGTAGTGDNLGHKAEHLAAWLDGLADERVGLTLDTCHLFAAGLDLRGDSYGETMDRFDDAFGLDRIKTWHLNDSKFPIGSRRDRHEEIGNGEIGLDGFAAVVNDSRFRGVPASLETEPETYKSDLRKLRKLRTTPP